MSIDSSTTSTNLSTFKNRLDNNSRSNKPLQAVLSVNEPYSLSRHSLKATSKESCSRPQTLTRTRTMSASEETSADTVPELSTMPTFSNKHDQKRDRRSSELKIPADRNDQLPAERRNSTPQIHLSSFLPHAFRNPKHHHKSNSKDDINSNNTAPSNNASTTPASYSSDMLTMKTDPSLPVINNNHFNDLQIKQDQVYGQKFAKSTTTPTNSSRLITSNSSEQLLSSQNEDTISSSSFSFDENSSELRSAQSFIVESHTPLCVSELYHNQFFDHFHTNYYGEFENNEGPFIASLRYFYHKTATTDTCEARAIIRTQFRNCDVTEPVNVTNEHNILQILFTKAHFPPVRSYGTIGDPKANEKIYAFDKMNDERFNCKIGVIYQRTNQIDEFDIFSNDDLTYELKDFIDDIAEKVCLRGFQKFRGDLDTKDDLHGEYSYYTQYENHEIMFNIAPMIPSTKANKQCIERKGLIGNAFVCVVFQEPGAIFSPDFISGKVIQIYITVQPTTNDFERYFKIGIWRRNDITAVIDPPGGIYKSDKSFRNYFLTLLLNAVNVAVESPNLRSRIFEQRQRLKYEELKKLSHLFSQGPIPDFTAEFENIHMNCIEIRPQLRSESFSSNMTVTTTDSTSTSATTNTNTNTNPGRISPVTKKRGFSKKLFGVFSSRSGSVSSPAVSPNPNFYDSSPLSPPPTAMPDGVMTLGRPTPPTSKDSVKRTRSVKSNQAPIPPSRSNNHLIPQSISVQPPTPSVTPLNPIASDNLTQFNLLNTAAFSLAPRNRSNSSPEDTVNTNKRPPFITAVIDEENRSIDSSLNDDDEEDISEDEKPINRPIICSSNITS